MDLSSNFILRQVTMIRWLLTICIVAPTLCFAINESADNGSAEQCSQMVKECFSSNGIQRSNCFYTSAKHPFCEGTDVGNLVYKRWSLSANSTIDGSTPPGLLGPSVYDEQCIEACDTQWLSTLVKGEYTATKGTDACLNSCKKENTIDQRLVP